MTTPTRSAYLAGLTLLSRRELSESQVRQRLARRGYPEHEIDEAAARLKSEGAINDARTAGAIARTETSIKRRGRLRVRRQIEQAGISGELARAAVDQVFADVDGDALMEAALDRRLRGKTIEDDRAFQRLYRYLVTQGFEADRVLRLLHRRRRGEPEP